MAVLCEKVYNCECCFSSYLQSDSFDNIFTKNNLYRRNGRLEESPESGNERANRQVDGRKFKG